MSEMTDEQAMEFAAAWNEFENHFSGDECRLVIQRDRSGNLEFRAKAEDADIFTYGKPASKIVADAIAKSGTVEQRKQRMVELLKLSMARLAKEQEDAAAKLSTLQNEVEAK